MKNKIFYYFTPIIHTMGKNLNILKFVLGFFIISNLMLSSCTDKDISVASNLNLKNLSIEQATSAVHNAIVQENPSFKLKNYDDPANTDLPQFSASCEPSNPGANFTCYTYHINTNIILPASNECPACSTVYVGYDVRVCQNNTTGLYSFHFFNFGIVPSGACSDWWNCLGNLDPADADRVIEEMRQMASLLIERNYVSYWVSLYSPLCPNTFFSSDMALETCYETCITPIANPPYYTLELISCGNKCCLRTRTFCKELSGLITISSPQYQTVGSSNCSNTSQCSVFSSGCYDRPCGTP